MSEERMLEAARRLLESVTPGDLDATLQQITAAAVEVLPDVDYASVTIRHPDGQLEGVAPTDDLLIPLDKAQSQLQQGPCFDAATDTVHVIAPDLANDTRFPEYGPIALAAGIRAQCALRLYDSPHSQGALNLYSHREGAFGDFSTVARLFTHQAALAISYAEQIGNLEEALHTRKTIGQAIGIVMERYGLTDGRAFAFLTRLSQTQNIKLRVIAAELVAQTEEQNHANDQSSGDGY